MPIEFFCPTCHSKLRTPDDTAGKMVRCPKCGQLDRIPTDQFVDSSAEINAPPDSVDTQPPSRSKTSFETGRSGGPRQHPQPGSAGPGNNPFSAPVTDRPLPQYHYQPSRESIRQMLIFPGATMIVVASFMLMLSLFGLLSFIASARNAGIRDDDWVAVVGTFVFGLLAGAGFLGGIAMLRQRGFGMAIAGSIATILAGIPCCFLPSSVGIWALVVLLSNDSRSVFR